MKNNKIRYRYFLSIMLLILIINITVVADASSDIQTDHKLTLKITKEVGIKSVEEVKLTPYKIVAVVIDMCDAHWCKTFTKRCGAMVPRMNHVLDTMRKLGIQICFAPSDVLKFYATFPQRRAVLAMPKHKRPFPKHFNLPIPTWGISGGCECGPERPCGNQKFVWTHQHPYLVIKDQDLIINCNDNRELYSICKEHGFTTLLYMGVAANMCVSWTRSCSILKMNNWDWNVF